VRVLVASDSVGSLNSSQASRAIASGWSTADVRVLPVGDSGAGFARAYADLLEAELELAVDGDVMVATATAGGTALTQVSGPGDRSGLALTTASSWPLGKAVAAILRDQRPDRLLVDLGGLQVHDAGAGLLAALGADGDQPLDQGVEPLGRLTSVDLSGPRALLGGTELVGVGPSDQLGQPLVGLRGITSSAGRAAGMDVAVLLATDAALERFAKLTAPEQAAAAGAGACGGLGFAVLALGGRLTTGPALAFDSVPGQRASSGVELVVTGCSVFDFARRGGGVVAAAAELAAGNLSPCVLIAGEVVIGAREMRAMGIEAAYAVRESALDTPTVEVTETELRRTAERVARSWRW
jgi:glycerate 2-kinase